MNSSLELTEDEQNRRKSKVFLDKMDTMKSRKRPALNSTKSMDGKNGDFTFE